ncbi:MAG: hypothetical protein FD149_2036 [Rhodospirillaceae bacterium]|nr:MAG: hypothetical protein FD149_2036 [Rhodospirillaceae bacterium]
MTLTLGLGAALSGLMTARKGLDLTAHNIANVNTEGFTRKDFNPVSRVLNAHGVGVEVMNATREVDEGLLRDIRREGGILKKLDVARRRPTPPSVTPSTAWPRNWRCWPSAPAMPSPRPPRSTRWWA